MNRAPVASQPWAMSTTARVGALIEVITTAVERSILVNPSVEIGKIEAASQASGISTRRM
jgi:hypothetical protein